MRKTGDMHRHVLEDLITEILVDEMNEVELVSTLFGNMSE